MIVSLGDVALDVFVRPHGTVLRGSDIAGTVRMLPGGSAANVSVWAARLGAPASFIGAVGDDPAAQVLRADFEREGVRAHLVTLDASTCMVAVVVDPASGERAMIPDRGAAAQLAAEMLHAEWLPAGCILHIPSYGLFAEPTAGAARRAITLCRAGGGRVSLDTSSVGPLEAFGREAYLALLETLRPDMLFANADEGAFLAGTADPHEGSAWLRRFAGTVIWKLGPGGALARAQEVVTAPGAAVVAVDTTGAGDAFAAAFLAALERGDAPSRALALANAVAAQVVQLIGARPQIAELPRSVG